jgi:hypothetical protein
MSSSVKDLKTKLSNGLTDLKVHASVLGCNAEREKKVAGLRANASSELKALRELKVAFEPEILRLAELDLAHVRNTGANVEALDDAQKIIVSLDKSIAANESIVSGTVDASLIDSLQPFDTASAIQEQIESLIEAVVKLSA